MHSCLFLWQVLLARGCSVNKPDTSGSTVVHHAARNGHLGEFCGSTVVHLDRRDTRQERRIERLFALRFC